MLRLSISGAHSVGKSTLAKTLIEHYSKKYIVAEIREVARQLIQSGFRMSQDITEYGIVNYINEYLRLERVLNGDFLISDRSLIDLLSYISVNSSTKVRSNFISLVEEIVYLETAKYDLFVYVPIEIPLEEDGVRPSDLIYREKIDHKIRELLDIYNTSWISVSGTNEERTKIVINKIEEISSTK